MVIMSSCHYKIIAQTLNTGESGKGTSQAVARERDKPHAPWSHRLRLLLTLAALWPARKVKLRSQVPATRQRREYWVPGAGHGRGG